MKRVLVSFVFITLFLSSIAYAGILPSSKTVYGEFMPSPEFALGRAPASDSTTDEVRMQVYRPFSDSDYVTLSKYLGAWGCKLGETSSDSTTVRAQVIYGKCSIDLVYDRSEQTMTVTYPSGTRPETAKGGSGTGKDILPSLRIAFSTQMPHPAAVFGRKANSSKTLSDESEQISYNNISEDDYVLFGCYAAAFGCTLDSYTQDGSSVVCTISRGLASFSLTYDNQSETLTLTYPISAYTDAASGKQRPTDESILPSPEKLYGVYVPTVAQALKRAADKTQSTAEGLIETYTSFTDADYNAFSSYLNTQSCELKGYENKNGVLTINLAKDGADFVFTYDKAAKTATVTYKTGSRPEISTFATPAPTPTPKPKATPTPTPRPRNYTVSQCYDKAVAYLKSRLKNPSSLQVHSYRYSEGDDAYTFYIDYSAQNGFGGYNRETYMCTVNWYTGNITLGYSF